MHQNFDVFSAFIDHTFSCFSFGGGVVLCARAEKVWAKANAWNMRSYMKAFAVKYASTSMGTDDKVKKLHPDGIRRCPFPFWLGIYVSYVNIFNVLFLNESLHYSLWVHYAVMNSCESWINISTIPIVSIFVLKCRLSNSVIDYNRRVLFDWIFDVNFIEMYDNLLKLTFHRNILRIILRKSCVWKYRTKGFALRGCEQKRRFNNRRGDVSNSFIIIISIVCRERCL